MTRPVLLLGGIVVGVLGILAHFALPWTSSDSSGRLEHFTYADLTESSFGGFGTGDGGSPIAMGLTLGLHGFFWGTALLAVAYVGVLVRGSSQALGAALALVGATAALVVTALFVIGGTVFGIELAKLMDETSAFASIRYSLNYASPALALILVGICIAHAFAAVGEARLAADAARAASAYAPYAPAPASGATRGATASATAPAAAPAPVGSNAPPPDRTAAPAAQSLPPARPAATSPPLERERQRAMERIAQAREHARGIARGSDDPAMTAWLRQTDAYLNALTLRVRDAKDAETLAAVERDVEQHVLRHG